MKRMSLLIILSISLAGIAGARDLKKMAIAVLPLLPDSYKDRSEAADLAAAARSRPAIDDPAINVYDVDRRQHLDMMRFRDRLSLER